LTKKNSLTPNPDVIDLTIDSLSYNGGRGVGRFEGVVVFVPFTAPGDVIRARVREQKPRFWEADLVEIVKPSSSRRAAPCPVFERCGGCSWQHVTYAAQVEQKQKILQDNLRGLKKLAEFEVQPLLAAPEEFGYRNRIQLQVRAGRFGFFAKRSRDLVSFKECLIAEKRINEAIQSFHPKSEGKVELALTEAGDLRIMEGERDSEAALFSQVNTVQNEALKNEMLEFIHVDPDWIMDLYSGSGNLTFPLAKAFPDKPLLAAEMSRTSVERGKKASGEFPQIRWEAGDVEKVLHKEKPQKGSGLIILDPPRTGVSKRVVEELLRLRPQQIVYVSCNPSTFARDAESLVRSGRFRLEKVRGLDMFPQTEHVELIASLCAAT
jgi:23S rRNA (uracil1939-C5)-methyltransferase